MIPSRNLDIFHVKDGYTSAKKKLIMSAILLSFPNLGKENKSLESIYTAILRTLYVLPFEWNALPSDEV